MKKYAAIHLLYALGIMAVAVWAYTIGSLTPQVYRLSEPDIHQYILDHNTGCDDINYNPKVEQKLVCEVFMQAEDDQIYIIKGDI